MRLAVSITALIAVVLVAGAAFANTPDPTFSTFDTFLGRSPNNDNATGPPNSQYIYRGNLRTAGNLPAVGVDNMIIELRILSPCQNPVVLNPDADSDGNGDIAWGILTLNQGGGSCLGSAPAAPVVEIHVIGFGLFWTLLSVTSPDEDGINSVDLADFALFRAVFNSGTPLYQGDMDGDGDIDLADFAWFRIHFNAV
jgi:hypothetical protein